MYSMDTMEDMQPPNTIKNGRITDHVSIVRTKKSELLLQAS